MCGIISYIGNTENGFNISYEGIKILQNRGYDSCGICGIERNTNTLYVDKYASSKDNNAVAMIGKHCEKYQNCKIITIHCRWCTHGAINDINAHPHTDNHNRIAVVHNGIIENFQELKDFLLDKDYFFKSETDTEVIAVLIGFYLDSGYKLNQAIKSTMQKLEGTWGVVITSKIQPDKLYLCKNGSPLLVGYDKNFAIVASESSAILDHVKSYFTLEDNEIIEIGLKNNNEIYISHNSKIIKEISDYFKVRCTQTEIDEYNQFENINEDIDTISVGPKLFTTTPHPYNHWMLKEIMEQPKSLLRTLNMGGRILDDYHVHLGGLRNNKEDLLKIKHLLIIGCGTSYYAGLLGAKYFKLLQSLNSVQVLDASEFTLKDIPRPYEEVGILVLSQSGETRDVKNAMQIADDAGIFTFSIVNVVGSMIATQAACGIYLNAGREVAVASTKSFTSQVLALSLIAIWYAENNSTTKQKRYQFIKSIRNLPTDASDLLETIEQQCIPVVNYLTKHNSIFILGRDLSEPVAYEGALKIKEISYLHAEGFPGGKLKHGPFALIEKGTPIIILVLDDEYLNKMKSAIMEVKARGAEVIIITNLAVGQKNLDKLSNYIIQIPKNKIFSSLLSVIPLQYLAYLLSLKFGYNPDYPRNLAKCVTVDG